MSVMMKINKDVTIITCSSMERGATLQLYLVIPKKYIEIQLIRKLGGGGFKCYS